MLWQCCSAAVLQCSLDEALAPLRQIQALLILLSLGAISVAVALGAMIARSITRPVALLRDFTQRLEQGDYTQALTVTAQDEIGDLARHFDLMREGNLGSPGPDCAPRLPRRAH